MKMIFLANRYRDAGIGFRADATTYSQGSDCNAM